jgi:hypothetical protein
MKKIKTEIGHTAYETTVTELILIGGFGICDECNEFAPKGYLVPVLNHYQCPKCFENWSKRAKFYSEDVEFERRTEFYYESKMPMVKG